MKRIGTISAVCAGLLLTGCAGHADPTPVTRISTVAANPLRVTITEPAAGATVLVGVLIVRGTVEAGGADVGITVNGWPASVQAASFAAIVPVPAGHTAPVGHTLVTAVATAASGTTASHSVGITVQQALPLGLDATSRSGIAPLTVRFSLGTVIPITAVTADFDGNGTIDFSGVTLSDVAYTYAVPGLYVARVTIVDAQGITRTSGTVIQVYDRAALDALLQAKWTEFRARLRGGDVEGASQFIALRKRDEYRQSLNALTVRASSIDLVLRNINFVSMADDRAEYQMIRIDQGTRLSYLVVWVTDEDGVWRLEFF